MNVANLSVSAHDLAQISSELRSLATEVEAVRLTPIEPVSWSFADIRSAPQVDLLEPLKTALADREKSRFVSVFDVVGECDSTAVRSAFERARKVSTGDRKFAKLSAGTGAVLYVGSSRKLVRRVSEHLGLVAATVYAMHLRQWLPDADLRGRLSLFCLPDALRDEVAQAIEDGLWRRLNPMLGRQGAR